MLDNRLRHSLKPLENPPPPPNGFKRIRLPEHTISPKEHISALSVFSNLLMIERNFIDYT